MQGRVLCVEIRSGMVSLICEQLSQLSGQPTPMKESLTQEAHDVKEEAVEESKAIKDEHVQDNTPPSRKIFRVLLNPILCKIEISSGDIITCHGFNLNINVQKTEDMTELFVK